MFVYGNDIPLDDAVIEGSEEEKTNQTVQPTEYVFEYGKDIFPAQATE